MWQALPLPQEMTRASRLKLRCGLMARYIGRLAFGRFAVIFIFPCLFIDFSAARGGRMQRKPLQSHHQ